METVKVKSTHKESQGDYVIINKEDFDPKQHTLYEEKPAKRKAQAESE